MLASSLEELPKLNKLILDSNKISEEGFKAIAPSLGKMTALQTLSLSGNEIGVGGSEELNHSLQKMTMLKKLDISSTKLSDDGFLNLYTAFKSMKVLKEVDISGNNEITDESAEMLTTQLKCGHNRNLRKVLIRDCSISSSSSKNLTDIIEANNPKRCCTIV